MVDDRKFSGNFDQETSVGFCIFSDKYLDFNSGLKLALLELFLLTFSPRKGKFSKNSKMVS